MTDKNGAEMTNFKAAATEFLAAEDGVVGVDWVFLTSAAVALTITVLTSLGGETVAFSDRSGDAISEVAVTF